MLHGKRGVGGRVAHIPLAQCALLVVGHLDVETTATAEDGLDLDDAGVPEPTQDARLLVAQRCSERASGALPAVRVRGLARTYTAYPLFDRSRPRNVCVRFGRATASTVMNRHDSFNSGMETTTLHATIEGRPTNRLRKSCGSAKPHRQEKLRARALHDENGRGGPMMPPGCCSRFV